VKAYMFGFWFGVLNSGLPSENNFNLNVIINLCFTSA